MKGVDSKGFDCLHVPFKRTGGINPVNPKGPPFNEYNCLALE